MRFTSFGFLKPKKAFSLIELSVVIIIIGILIAGVTQGAKMLNTFRLQSAQTLTLSSPVVSTAGLVLWLEPTMPQSFLDVESVEGSQITKWIDRNPQATIKLSANGVASAGIVYKEQSDIYGLPAVAFSGSSSAVLTLNNGSSNVPIITPDSAYTLFIVAKLSDDSSTALKTVFSNGDSSGWGYGVSGVQNSRSRNLIFGGSTNVTSATPNATTKPEVISALYTGGSGGNLQLFTNGVGSAGSGEAGTSESLSASTATAKTPTSAFYVGNKSSAAPWTGLISEIIVFNRVLSAKERNAIELYLGQKYNIKTATTGNIEGCSVNIAGVTQKHVSEGSSNLPCLADGYSGNVSYDCSGGILTPSGSCTIFQCAINGELGIVNGTMVNYAATPTPVACNDVASGYSGSINYTCTNSGGFIKASGSCSAAVCTITNSLQPSLNNKTNLPYAASATAVPSAPTSACATGYTGSPTYTCTSAGEATIVTPCSPIQCTVGAPAYNAKTLNYAASATAIPNTPTSACATGYSGSPTYTCTSAGSATITSGACTAITCSITGVANFNDKTDLPYAATATAIPNTPTSACASGYSGSPTYTCTTSGAANISGTCDVPFKCSSGGAITTSGGYRVHTFTTVTSNTMTCNGSQLNSGLSMLVVGGGGPGGSGNSLVACGFGGGGGGGQVIEVLNSTIPSGVTSIVVNVAGTTIASGTKGQNSTVISNESSINITAYGGVFGGLVNSSSPNNDIPTLRPGGGAGSLSLNSTTAGGLGTKNGGKSSSPGTVCNSSSPSGGGGGGSTMNSGSDATSVKGGDGGNGFSSSVPTASGYYGCGGGGGSNGNISYGGNCNNSYGTGTAFGSMSAKNGLDNRGGGGGGGGSSFLSGGKGGSGIVIIAYPDS